MSMHSMKTELIKLTIAKPTTYQQHYEDRPARLGKAWGASTSIWNCNVIFKILLCTYIYVGTSQLNAKSAWQMNCEFVKACRPMTSEVFGVVPFFGKVHFFASLDMGPQPSPSNFWNKVENMQKQTWLWLLTKFLDYQSGPFSVD